MIIRRWHKKWKEWWSPKGKSGNMWQSEVFRGISHRSFLNLHVSSKHLQYIYIHTKFCYFLKDNRINEPSSHVNVFEPFFPAFLSQMIYTHLSLCQMLFAVIMLTDSLPVGELSYLSPVGTYKTQSQPYMFDWLYTLTQTFTSEWTLSNNRLAIVVLRWLYISWFVWYLYLFVLMYLYGIY